MKFPDTLTVLAINSESGMPIANLAFVIILKARRKNDYCVGPVSTNEEGRANVSRIDCERTIARNQEMFIMDYQDDLSACKPFAEVRLHLPQHIEVMISQYESQPVFWGSAFDDPQSMMADMRRARNSEFEPASRTVSESDLAADPVVTFFLKRKDQLES